MKTAVVFYGSMRELTLGSKFWKYLAKDADYFVVTWDVVNTHRTDYTKPYPFDVSKFPVPVKSSIIVNYQMHIDNLTNMGIKIDGSLLHILYHWSLIKNLPDISSYNTIIVTRTDIACGKPFGRDWIPRVIPGKTMFIGSESDGVNDWLFVTDPIGLEGLHFLYHNAIATKDFMDDNGYTKIIHSYLVDKIKEFPDKLTFNGDNFILSPLLIRPHYHKIWETLPASNLLIYLIYRHWLEFEKNLSETGYDEEEVIRMTTHYGFDP